MVMPASTVTVLAARSTPTTRSMCSRDSSRPSVHAASVKEWPPPNTLTRCPAAFARCTASATSTSERGRSIVSGRQCWLPAQLDHRSDTRPPSGPPELAQTRVAHAEVMTDLVQHRHPYLSGELLLVARPRAQRPLEDRDAIREHVRVPDRPAA